MRNRMFFGASRIAVFAAITLTSASLFAGQMIPIVEHDSAAFDPTIIQPITDGNNGSVVGPGEQDLDAERDWANTGTDFNTTTSWTGGVVPTLGDVAWFKAAEITNPNLSSSVSIAGLYFQGTGSNGYDITASAGQSFTLTGSNTSGSGGTANSSAAAIRNEATSGTNTIDAPLILAPSSGTVSTFFNVAGGTLIVNGAISGSGISLSLKSGTIQLNGNNSFSGGASIDAASTTLVLGNDNALGTGTFTINNTATLQAGGAARTLANSVVFGGNTTLSGSNAFTFSGTVTSSGSSTRTLTVSNTGGATFNGTVNLEESGAPAGRIFIINGTTAVVMNGVVQNGSAQAAGLRYTGSSSLTLNGANTYSGGTSMTVAGSTMVTGPNGTLGTGNVSLTAGNITLTLQNVSSMASTATLSFVNTDTINLNYGASMTISGLIVDGVAQPNGLYGQGFNNPDSAFFGEGTITVVPEPTTIGMVLLGGSLLAGLQRFRRRQG